MPIGFIVIELPERCILLNLCKHLSSSQDSGSKRPAHVRIARYFRTSPRKVGKFCLTDSFETETFVFRPVPKLEDGQDLSPAVGPLRHIFSTTARAHRWAHDTPRHISFVKLFL